MDNIWLLLAMELLLSLQRTPYLSFIVDLGGDPHPKHICTIQPTLEDNTVWLYSKSMHVHLFKRPGCGEVWSATLPDAASDPPYGTKNKTFSVLLAHYLKTQCSIMQRWEILVLYKAIQGISNPAPAREGERLVQLCFYLRDFILKDNYSFA